MLSDSRRFAQSIRRAYAVRSCLSLLGQWYADNNTFRSFDLCADSGAGAAFFPAGRGAMLGNYKEVSCDEWTGSCPVSLWNDWCMGNTSTGLWPAKGCGNDGMKHSLPCAVIQFRLTYTLRNRAVMWTTESAKTSDEKAFGGSASSVRELERSRVTVAKTSCLYRDLHKIRCTASLRCI